MRTYFKVVRCAFLYLHICVHYNKSELFCKCILHYCFDYCLHHGISSVKKKPNKVNISSSLKIMVLKRINHAKILFIKLLICSDRWIPNKS